MNKYIILSLLLAFLLAPATMDARKKKDKKQDKRAIDIENATADVEQPLRLLTINNPAQQLYGESTKSARSLPLKTPEQCFFANLPAFPGSSFS